MGTSAVKSVSRTHLVLPPQKSLIHLAHKYHSCSSHGDDLGVLWTTWYGARDDVCVPQYTCSDPTMRSRRQQTDVKVSEQPGPWCHVTIVRFGVLTFGLSFLWLNSFNRGPPSTVD